MAQHLRRIWRDECGSVLSVEVLMLTTLLAIGLMVGVKSIRDSAVTEWADFAQAFANLDQSYHVPNTFTLGVNNNDGLFFDDERDFCDDALTNNPSVNSNSGDANLPGPFITFPDPTPETP